MDGKCAEIFSSDNSENYEFGGCNSMTKVYCKCGRIIGLDAGQTKLKFSLKKRVECTECRNARISREIDELNVHFNPEGAETF